MSFIKSVKKCIALAVAAVMCVLLLMPFSGRATENDEQPQDTQNNNNSISIAAAAGDILPHPTLVLDGINLVTADSVAGKGEYSTGNGIQTWVTGDHFQHDADGKLIVPLVMSGTSAKEGLHAADIQAGNGWVVYNYPAKVNISEIWMNGWWNAGLKSFALEYLDADGETWVSVNDNIALDVAGNNNPQGSTQGASGGTQKVYTLPAAVVTTKLRIKIKTWGSNNSGAVMTLCQPRGFYVEEVPEQYEVPEEIRAAAYNPFEGRDIVFGSDKYSFSENTYNAYQTAREKLLEEITYTFAGLEVAEELYGKVVDAANALNASQNADDDTRVNITGYGMAFPATQTWLVDGQFIPVRLSGDGSVTLTLPEESNFESLIVISKNGKTTGPATASVNGGAPVSLEFIGARDYLGVTVPVSGSGSSLNVTFTPRPGQTYFEIDELVLNHKPLPTDDDLSELQDLYDIAVEIVTSDDYTTSTWAAFSEALTDAKAVLDKGVAATAEEADAAYEVLEGAMEALTERGNTDELENLYNESASEFDENSYTSDSWANFESAMAAAKAIIDDNSDSSQADVTVAADVLNDAIANLEMIQTVSKEELNTLINTANNAKDGVQISEDGSNVPKDTMWVTEDEMQALEDAIAKAEQVVLNADSTQEDVDQALNDLETAINAFEAAQEDGKKPTDSDDGGSQGGKKPTDSDDGGSKGGTVSPTKRPAPSPQTGDESNMIIWAAITAIAAIITMFTASHIKLKLRKKRL